MAIKSLISNADSLFNKRLQQLKPGLILTAEFLQFVLQQICYCSQLVEEIKRSYLSIVSDKVETAQILEPTVNDTLDLELESEDTLTPAPPVNENPLGLGNEETIPPDDNDNEVEELNGGDLS